MTLFQILWIIAGFIIGWIGIDLIAALIVALGKIKMNVPYKVNIAIGFVGALIAYTIIRGHP